jgi:hypothetical protein
VPLASGVLRLVDADFLAEFWDQRPREERQTPCALSASKQKNACPGTQSDM